MSSQLAFVFPGQGSQAVGMLAEQAATHSIIIDTFAEASDVLGYDLWNLVSHGPEDQLNQTEFTQPALMAADVALWRVWCELHEQRPAVMAGHSLGEFVALVCADSIDFTTAVRLVALRGRFMQEAVPAGTGAMAAIIGLDDVAVADLCEQVAAGDVVAPANYNSVGQVVIAGHTSAVQRAVDAAKAAGAKLAKMIPVSVPSHCLLMQSAADRLNEALNDIEIRVPKIPVIQNVDADIHQDPQTIRDNLVLQLTAPVHWVMTIQSMQRLGITEIIECGPGKVLQGLIKRIDRALTLGAVS